MVVSHLKVERGMTDKEITDEFVNNVFKTITKSGDKSLSRQELHQYLYREESRATPTPPQHNIFETPIKERNQALAVQFEVEQSDSKEMDKSKISLYDDVMARIKKLEGSMGAMKMEMPDKASLKVMKDEQGYIYIGQMNKLRQYHGFGIEKSEDGNVYAGSWVDNRPSGKGWLLSEGGDTYRGDISDGTAHGHGT